MSPFFEQHRQMNYGKGWVPIPFLFNDYLAQVSENDPDITVAAAVRLAYALAVRELTQDELEGLVARLQKRSSEPPSEQPKNAASPDGKKYWGSNLAEWSLSSSTFDICCYVADYDVEKARKLYCETDSELVYELAKVKYAKDYEFARANFEAAVYGFGGGFDGNAGNADVVDLVNGGDSAMAELASFFGPAH